MGKHCYQFFWSKSQVNLPVPIACQGLVDLLKSERTTPSTHWACATRVEGLLLPDAMYNLVVVLHLSSFQGKCSKCHFLYPKKHSLKFAVL